MTVSYFRPHSGSLLKRKASYIQSSLTLTFAKKAVNVQKARHLTHIESGDRLAENAYRDACNLSQINFSYSLSLLILSNRIVMQTLILLVTSC